MEINIRNDVSGDFVDDMTLIGYCDSPTNKMIRALYDSSPLARAVTKGVADDVFSNGVKVVSKNGADKPDLTNGIRRLSFSLAQAYGLARATNNAIFYIKFDGEKNADLSKKPKYKEGKKVELVSITDAFEILDSGNVRVNKKKPKGGQDQITIAEARCIQLIPNPNEKSMLYYTYNHITRIESIAGASGLAFIQNNRADLVVNGSVPSGADDEAVEAISSGIKGVIEKIRRSLSHGTKRLVMGGIGFDAKVITYPTASPINTLKGLYQIVSTYYDIPLRILTGEGSGRLAGSEDYATYDATIQAIRNEYGAIILEELTAALIDLSYLSSGDRLEFSEVEAANNSEQADTEKKQEEVTTARLSNGKDLGLSGKDLLEYVKTGSLDNVNVTNMNENKDQSGNVDGGEVSGNGQDSAA